MSERNGAGQGRSRKLCLKNSSPIVQECLPVLGWVQPGGESMPAAAEIVKRLFGETECRPLARPYGGVRQLGVPGQVQGQPLRGLHLTGGTGFGETRSAGHLLRIETPGRRGML